MQTRDVCYLYTVWEIRHKIHTRNVILRMRSIRRISLSAVEMLHFVQHDNLFVIY